MILFSAMDYLIGFMIGYGIREIAMFLNKLSHWDYDNRRSYEFDLDPLTEDDLP